MKEKQEKYHKAGQIKAMTYEDFVKEIAEDCIADMTEEEKDYIRDNPFSINYHMGYSMYIRNHYIYDNLDKLEFEEEPDDLSGAVMRHIISILSDDDLCDLYLYRLYSHREFINMRKAYHSKFGEYPKKLVEKYRSSYPETKSDYEYMSLMLGLPAIMNNDDKVQTDKAWIEFKEEIDLKEKVISALIAELAEAVCNTDEIMSFRNEE